jgi:predicted nucleic acid-binding Zn ribbon protein
MKVAYRNYKCRNCGHVQPILTNHKLACIDHCKECSWKPSFGQYAIPFNGRTYRPFDYSGRYVFKAYA